jgi:hypothetical protein
MNVKYIKISPMFGVFVIDYFLVPHIYVIIG